MNQQQAYKLQAGQKVKHGRYGTCTVLTVTEDYGVVIEPDSHYAKELLSLESNSAYGAPFLESEFEYMSLIK